MLFGIDAQVLPRMMFPVGEFRKDEIRGMARELGLRVADKKDSQEICFVSAGDYADFVRRRAAAMNRVDERRGGQIVTTDGTVVGRARGLGAVLPSASARAWAWRSASRAMSCGLRPTRGAS